MKDPRGLVIPLKQFERHGGFDGQESQKICEKVGKETGPKSGPESRAKSWPQGSPSSRQKSSTPDRQESGAAIGWSDR